MKNIFLAALLAVVLGSILFVYFRDKRKTQLHNQIVDRYNQLNYRSDAIAETFNKQLKDKTGMQKFMQQQQMAIAECNLIIEDYDKLRFQMSANNHKKQCILLADFAIVFKDQLQEMELFFNTKSEEEKKLSIEKINTLEKQKETIAKTILENDK